MCTKKFKKEKNDPISKALEKLCKIKKTQLDIGLKIMEAYHDAVYPVDLMAIGAINRSLSLIKGFCTLIESRNLICAAPILRLQLDTALRFSAATIDKDPHDFARKIVSGE